MKTADLATPFGQENDFFSKPDANDPTPSRQLLDYLGLCVFVLEEDTLTFVNTAFLCCLDYKQAKDVLGQPLLTLIHPEDQKRFRERDWSLHPSDDDPFRFFAKDGRIVWARLDIRPLSPQSGSGKIGCLTDVTVSVNRRTSLENALEKYKTIIDDVEDVLAEVDLRGNILSVNNNANLKIWGAPREQTIGTNYRCYVDKAYHQIVSDAYRQIYSTGRPGKVTYEIIRTDGQRRFVEDSVSLMINSAGNPTGFRVVSRDVTDRKRTEQQLAEHRMCLETIFTSVKDAIITVDTEMRVLEANKSTENICGIRLSGIRGRSFPECVGPCNASCCEVIRMTLSNKTTIRDYRVNCGLAGRDQMVNITSSPLLNSEGDFLGAVLVIRDVTLLKSMERELRERNQFHNIIGQSKKMRAIYALVESLADLDTTVLITGESGTGKELVARALHYGGRRAFKPFVAVNCSALTESLLESELFGHVKGAFTGATREREGRFQAASSGTILLDEIGDLSPLIQLKLLRVLQEKIFERVGDSKQHKANVRIITCTNRELKERVRSGEMREDLYYRLKVVEIALPPLRERLEDIPLLVEHFRKTFNEKLNKQVERVSQDVLGSFMECKWPGNVRELEHIMEHAFVLCQGDEISLDDLPLEFRESIRSNPLSGKALSENTPSDSEAITNALTQARGNKAKAARLLGISRQTIYRKIYQYRLPSGS